jgi:predicted dehydrogenase
MGIPGEERENAVANYRAGIVGLGWTGFLGHLGDRYAAAPGYSPMNPRLDAEGPGQYSVDDVERPTPGLDIHRTFHYHDHPGLENLAGSHAEALWDRPELDLVAGAERDKGRLKAFGERYGITALYTDAAEMLRKEKLDIVTISTNVKGRADLTCTAVEHGAKGIMTDYPMAHTLEETDRMVKTCADAGVPLCVGALIGNHPSFATAKELVRSGAIGDVISIEAARPESLNNYFIDSAPAWVSGTGDRGPSETGSDMFVGQGIAVTVDGQVVHYRKEAPLVRVTGTTGEILFRQEPNGWRLWQDIEIPAGVRRIEMPWPEPLVVEGSRPVYMLQDILDCLDGKLDEPKLSGRRTAMAIELHVALKLSSAQGGARVDLPLKDRSLGLAYDWWR